MQDAPYKEAAAPVNRSEHHSTDHQDGHPNAYWYVAGILTALLITFLFIAKVDRNPELHQETVNPPVTQATAAPASSKAMAQPTAPPPPKPENYAWKLAQGDGNRYGRDLYGEFIQLMEVSRRLFPNDTDRQIYDAVIMLREAGNVMDLDVGRLVCHQMLNGYADGQASSYEVAVGIMTREVAAYARKKSAEEYLSGSKPLHSWTYSDTCIFCGASAARTYPVCRTHAKEYRMSPDGHVQSLKDNLDLQLVWNAANQVYDIYVVRRSK